MSFDLTFGHKFEKRQCPDQHDPNKNIARDKNDQNIIIRFIKTVEHNGRICRVYNVWKSLLNRDTLNHHIYIE